MKALKIFFLILLNLSVYRLAVSAQDIDCNPVFWNYGPVDLWNHSYSDKIFIVSNTGNANLVVTATTLTGTNASEFFIDSGGGAFTLSPGATRNIEVRFYPASAGNKSAALSISSNDPDENPFLVGLTGIGRAGDPHIYTIPSSLDYGAVNPGSYSDKILTIGSNGQASLHVTNFILTGANASEFSVQNTSVLYLFLEPGTSWDFVVRFSPTSVGPKSASLMVCSNTLSPPDVIITLNGIGGAPDIGSNPESWDYGVVNTGSRLEKRFYITNTGDINLDATATAITGANASEFYIQSGGGAFCVGRGWTHDIVVQFDPTSTGSKKASLCISSNDPDENPFIISLSGTGKGSGVENGSMEIPTSFSLEQNYPNPFNPSTVISFGIPKRSFVSLKVLDLQGREMATLVSEELSAGSYTRQWNAVNLPGGVYFYRLEAGPVHDMKKCVFLK